MLKSRIKLHKQEAGETASREIESGFTSLIKLPEKRQEDTFAYSLAFP